MTGEEYWESLQNKNPHFPKEDDSVLKIKMRDFKRIVMQAHQKGKEEADGNNLFKSIFGR